MSEPRANHDKQSSGCFGLVFMLIVGFFWSVITLACDGVIVWGVFQQLRAVGYSTTQGRIDQSEVEEDPGGDEPSYHAKLKYSYRAADRVYAGSRYRYGLRLSSRPAVQRIVADHPVGKRVVVFYCPNDPQDSVLRTGLGGDDLLVAMFMVPFNLVMLGIWIGVRGSFHTRAAEPFAGGAKVLDDGICVRVRLTSLPPLTAAAIAVGAVSFLGVFIVAFGFGADPTMPVMLMAWAVILAAGLCRLPVSAEEIAAGRLRSGDRQRLPDCHSSLHSWSPGRRRGADVPVHLGGSGGI